MILKFLNSVRPDEAYRAGRDCALNGANTTNCHFKYFASRELTSEWERGKAEAEGDDGKKNTGV